MSLLDKIRSKEKMPTNERFDCQLLNCCTIYNILNDKILLSQSAGDEIYFRTYSNGRALHDSMLYTHDKQIEGGGKSINTKNQLPQLTDEEINEFAKGKRFFDSNAADKLLRQRQSLDEVTSGRLTAIITYSDKPGYSRLYPMLKGAFMLGVDAFVTVENDAATAGLWVFAQQQTGSVNYNVVDLRNEI